MKFYKMGNQNCCTQNKQQSDQKQNTKKPPVPSQIAKPESQKTADPVKNDDKKLSQASPSFDQLSEPTQIKQSQEKQASTQKQQKEPVRQIKPAPPRKVELNFDKAIKPSLYSLTTEFPVSLPYAKCEDYEKILRNYRKKMGEIDGKKYPPPDHDMLSSSLLAVKNRNWIADLVKAHNDYIRTFNNASFDSFAKHKKLLQLREHFNWVVWALSWQFFQGSRQIQNLPKSDAIVWREGFAWKGMWIQVLPQDEATFVLDEIKALGQIQIELLQALTIDPPPLLSKQIIVPLAAACKCGSWLLYATPQIYTQEVGRKTEVGKKEVGDKIESDFMPRVSSMTMIQDKTINLPNLIEKNKEKYQSLYRSMDNPQLIQKECKQHFQKYTMLRSLNETFLLPILDAQKLAESEVQDPNQRQAASQNVLYQQKPVDINYILINTKQLQKQLKSTDVCSFLFVMPSTNDELLFQKYPQQESIELRKLQKMLNDCGIKPKGDDFVSPELSPNNSQSSIKEQQTPNTEAETQQVTKKTMTKNGWNLMLIQLGQQGNDRKFSENKRATSLFNMSKHTYKSQQSSSVYLSAMPIKRKQEFAQLNQNQLTQIKPQQAAAVPNSESVFGPVIINAQLDKGLNVLPQIANPTYSEGIETVLQSQLNSLAELLNNQQERCLNSNTLKEFMHQRGLNIRFLWLLLPKLTLKKARDLVMVSIMLRVIKKTVYQKVEQKSQSNQVDLASFKEAVAMIVNALVKQKYAKYKQVFDELLLGLFLHRLQVVQVANRLDLPKHELNYLESKDIIDHINQSPNQCPTLFLNEIQSYFGLTFTPEFVRVYRQDSFGLLAKNQLLTTNDFKSVDLQLKTVMSLRETAYYMLAWQMHRDNNTRKLQNSMDISIDTQRQHSTTDFGNKQPETHRNFKNNLGVSQGKGMIVDLSKRRQPQCEIQLPASLYKGPNQNQNYILQPSYTLPSSQQLGNWVLILDQLFRDCHSPCYDNADQVLIEARLLKGLTSFVAQENSEETQKIFQEIHDILQESTSISPEIISFVSMLTALWSDNSNEVELINSERSYIAAMMALMTVVGDPRGRGNSGLPIMMLFAWKLQILASAGKKTQDSELAEELFDALLHSFVSFKRMFKQQTQQVVEAQNKNDQVPTKYTNLINGFTEHEYKKYFFDVKQKYNKRPNNVLTAGGFLKSSIRHQKPHSAYKRKDTQDEANLSDVEFNLMGDDEAELESKAANLRTKHEYSLPFSHWMINRQLFQQMNKSISKESQQEQKDSVNKFVRDSLNKLYPSALLEWITTYNPIYQQSGQQWDNQTVKEFCFGQNNQIFSSSGSSAAFSSSGRSSRSLNSSRYDNQLQTKRKHIMSYTQIFSKELGIQKQEMQGLLYIWGSDTQGQLGLDHYYPQQKQMMLQQALKLLHPRICISLKDELIKEVACGYAFTFAINHFGQAWCWGSNDMGQLGLGLDFQNVAVVRAPQQNSNLCGIVKLVAGNEHALALTKQGELYSWGSAHLTGHGDKQNRHTPFTLDEPTNVKQISCGGLHSMVVTKQGLVYCWGSNEGGQLGIDSDPNNSRSCIVKPTCVDFLKKNNQFIVQVAGGETHTVALTAEGKLWGWGMSMYGQLGLNFSADSFEPGQGLLKSKVLVPQQISPFLPPHAEITQIYCGATFTLLQTKEGELYGCGINDLGQLGLDQYIEEMQLALMDRSKYNQQQQMSTDIIVPQKIICFEKMNVQHVVCGENHSLAVIGEERNMLWSWGMYRNGQLGLGDVQTKMNPRPIQNLCAGNIYGIGAGSQHSVALLGEHNRISLLQSPYIHGTDILYNPWLMDFEKLRENGKR